jgi:hypothetical protein
MNPSTRTAATESTRPVPTASGRLPRRPRIGSAIASALVTGVLFGSVVLGMTSMGDDGRQVVAAAHAPIRT